MTSANSGRLDDSASVPNSGSTTLHGRIEAIGIHDLLRVSTSKGGTGRLLVFNDDSDAEIYYEQGRVVAVVTGASFGHECLQQVLQMQHGEFEFAVGLRAPAERQTPNLHEAMLQSVREYYERQVRARQAANGAAGDEARSSGVHKIDGQEKGAAPAAPPPIARTPSPPEPGPARNTSLAPQQPAPSSQATAAASRANVPSAAIPRPTPAQPEPLSGASKPVPAASPKTAAAQQLSPGELGRGTIDASGRMLQRQGALTQHDAALAALALKLAARLGPSLGAREPVGIELHAPGEKSLICAIAADGIRISKVSADSDIESIWKQLKT